MGHRFRLASVRRGTDSMQVGRCAAGGAVYGPAGAAGLPGRADASGRPRRAVVAKVPAGQFDS